ncbi:Uma2 family endonuclease, partial [Streptomyces sp. NPDC054961]
MSAAAVEHPYDGDSYALLMTANRIMEVTSSHHSNDLKTKVRAYAQAGIPVYVIVDRKNVRVHLLTDPVGEGYDQHTLYAAGQRLTLPDSIGAKVTLDAAALLEAGGRLTTTPDATPWPNPLAPQFRHQRPHVLDHRRLDRVAGAAGGGGAGGGGGRPPQVPHHPQPEDPKNRGHPE